MVGNCRADGVQVIFARFAAAVNALLWLLRRSLIVSLVMLVAVLFAGVVCRYVLRVPFIVEESVASYLMLYIAFVGLAPTLRAEQHPAISVLINRLPARAHRAVQMIGLIVVGGYLLLIVYSGIKLVIASQVEQSDTLGISMSWPFAILPLGAAAAGLELLRKQWQINPRPVAFFVLLCGDAAVAAALFAYPGGVEYGGWALLCVLLPALLAAEVPVAFAIGIFATVVIRSSGTPFLIIAQQMIDGISAPAFLAIPTFILAGALLAVTGMADQLVDLFVCAVGRLPGGLAIADTLASAVFADTSGSAVADTAALGSVMVPQMVERGYDDAFASAHQAAAGSLGTLLPPSISAIIFASVTNTSVTHLFRVTMVPGIALILAYIGIPYVVAMRRHYPREPGFRMTQFVQSVPLAIPALIAPIIVLGGILGGVFTPTEAGAVAVVYVAAVSTLTYWRRPKLDDWTHAAEEAIERTCIVLFIIANTAILAWGLAATGLPQTISQVLFQAVSSPFAVLSLSAIAILCLAVVLEPPAILVGAVPLLLPVVIKAGIDPVLFGVVGTDCRQHW